MHRGCHPEAPSSAELQYCLLERKYSLNLEEPFVISVLKDASFRMKGWWSLVGDSEVFSGWVQDRKTCSDKMGFAKSLNVSGSHLGSKIKSWSLPNPICLGLCVYKHKLVRASG